MFTIMDLRKQGLHSLAKIKLHVSVALRCLREMSS